MSLRIRTLLLVAAVAVAAGPALPQNPLTVYPNNYKLALDNADITVVQVHYGPHEKIGAHNHSKFPTVYVYLNDSGQVRFTHDEIPPFVMTRPPVKEGSFRVSPGRIEVHMVENLSELPSDYLRIELKKLPLHNTLHPVRGSAPESLTPGSSEEFSTPELSIHRIVCNVGKSCAASALPARSLLVAFSPFKMATPHAAEKQMQSGEILWVEHAQTSSITATANAPAHLLEITLKPSAN